MESKDMFFEKICEVPGFNPDEFLQLIADENGEPKKTHLPVRIQKAWFRLKYPNGKIALTPIKMDDQCSIFRARVYADRNDPQDNFIAEGYAQRKFDERIPDMPVIEWAQTAAVGRALTDAGFGLKYDHSGEIPLGMLPDNNQKPTVQSEKKTDNKPASSAQAQPEQAQPAQVQPKQTQTQRQSQARQPQPAATQQKSANQPASSGQSSAKPSNEPSNKQTPIEGLTYEQAKTIVMPFGDNKGRTLGDIALNSPKDFEWVAKKYSGTNTLLKQAAMLIWNTAAAMSSSNKAA